MRRKNWEFDEDLYYARVRKTPAYQRYVKGVQLDDDELENLCRRARNNAWELEHYKQHGQNSGGADYVTKAASSRCSGEPTLKEAIDANLARAAAVHAATREITKGWEKPSAQSVQAGLERSLDGAAFAARRLERAITLSQVELDLAFAAAMRKIEAL